MANRRTWRGRIRLSVLLGAWPTNPRDPSCDVREEPRVLECVRQGAGTSGSPSANPLAARRVAEREDGVRRGCRHESRQETADEGTASRPEPESLILADDAADVRDQPSISSCTSWAVFSGASLARTDATHVTAVTAANSRRAVTSTRLRAVVTYVLTASRVADGSCALIERDVRMEAARVRGSWASRATGVG